jgi:hypothetical protein
MNKDRLENLIALCEELIKSADNPEWCNEGLTVVDKEKLNLIEDFIVNFCEKP